MLKLLLSAIGLALCGSGGVGLWLRLSQKRQIMTLLGAETAPEYFLRYPEYWYRLSCLWLIWLGLTFLLCSRDPVRFEPLVRLHAWGLLASAAAAVVLGNYVDVWRPLWLSNAAAYAALGLGLLMLARKLRRAPEQRA
jgi:hypothetical protein